MTTSWKELVVVDTERLSFIVVGAAIVFAVGQLLARSGRRYLAGSAPAERAAAGPAASLVAVLFHLLTLGIVALLSVLSVGSTAEYRFLIQLGIFLVILAAVYGIALMLINRRRTEALAAEIDTHGEIRRDVPVEVEEERREVRMRPIQPDVDMRPMDPGVDVRPADPMR